MHLVFQDGLHVWLFSGFLGSPCMFFLNTHECGDVSSTQFFLVEVALLPVSPSFVSRGLRWI